MKPLSLLFILFVSATTLFACQNTPQNENVDGQAITSTTYTRLSARLIRTLQADGAVQEILDSLAAVPQAVLAEELSNDARRKAFWINVYNGYIQVLLKADPNLYEDRGAFFTKKRFTVAGEQLSFDDVEHGIIRRSKIKLSLGLLSKWNVSDFEKKFRADKTDGRVHFILNCGAKSCPAVAAYDVERLEEQMDKSVQLHLKNTSTYVATTNTVRVTSLFSWFRGDFGNKRGMRNFLKHYEIIPQDAKKTTIEFETYDWTLFLDNYIVF